MNICKQKKSLLEMRKPSSSSMTSYLFADGFASKCYRTFMLQFFLNKFLAIFKLLSPEEKKKKLKTE